MVAYAVQLKDGHVPPETVGPTPRSAMVNWLWRNGTPVPDCISDEKILKLWKAASQRVAARIVLVDLEVHGEWHPSMGPIAPPGT